MSTSLELLTGGIADIDYSAAPQPRYSVQENAPPVGFSEGKACPHSETLLCPSDQSPCHTDECPTPCTRPYNSTEEAPQ